MVSSRRSFFFFAGIFYSWSSLYLFDGWGFEIFRHLCQDFKACNITAKFSYENANLYCFLGQDSSARHWSSTYLSRWSGQRPRVSRVHRTSVLAATRGSAAPPAARPRTRWRRSAQKVRLLQTTNTSCWRLKQLTFDFEASERLYTTKCRPVKITEDSEETQISTNNSWTRRQVSPNVWRVEKQLKTTNSWWKLLYWKR